MLKSPQSLQDICVDFICDNKHLLKVKTNHDGNAHSYRVQNVSEQLLATLSTRDKLDDATLSMFDCSVTSLGIVNLHNASKLTKDGLQVLKGHKVSELVATCLTETTSLIECLSNWTRKNMRSLNVAHSTFNCRGGSYVGVVSLCGMTSLQSLNVRSTDFNNAALQVVVDSLPSLQNLDISYSQVTDISFLIKCKDRLKSLTMFNLKGISYEKITHILCELYQLRHLDISDDRRAYQPDEPSPYKITSLLKNKHSLPFLVSLDISGKKDIQIEDLQEFLKYHPGMKFLGLMGTKACLDAMFKKENTKIIVTGLANRDQAVESLRRYINRPLYLLKALQSIAKLSLRYVLVPEVDVLKAILSAIRAHPKYIVLHIYAASCLCNLSRLEMAKEIHPHYLQQIVECNLQAMEESPQYPQLQKTAFQTLDNEWILKTVSFDRLRCARLVMDRLCLTLDPIMTQMGVSICHYLTQKISPDDNVLIGSNSIYMKKLLNILEHLTNEGVPTRVMVNTLGVIQVLTVKSSCTCTILFEEKGFDLLVKILTRFPGNGAVEAYVLAIVKNIVGVKNLRSKILSNEFIIRFSPLMNSSVNHVSFYAAGTIAHLAGDNNLSWTPTLVSKSSVLHHLKETVLSWGPGTAEFAKFSCFNSMLPLLSCESYEVQLWAVWTIHAVTSKQPARYSHMLVNDGISEILHKIFESPDTHPLVLTITEKILHILDKHAWLGESAEIVDKNQDIQMCNIQTENCINSEIINE